MDLPETRYVKVGDVHIAYQTVGEGATDLVLVPGIFTHVEYRAYEGSSHNDAHRNAGHGRYLAAHITWTRLVELPGVDHLPLPLATRPDLRKGLLESWRLFSVVEG